MPLDTSLPTRGLRIRFTHLCTHTGPGMSRALQPETYGLGLPSSLLQTQCQPHLPVGRCQLQDTLGFSPTHQMANISFETPWATQPAALGPDTTHHEAETSFRTPQTLQLAMSGIRLFYQWSQSSSGTPGLCTQRPQDLALSASCKRHKSLWVKWKSNMNVVYSMGKYSHYFVIALKRISPVKILNHYIIHLKLIKYCKSTTLKLTKRKAGVAIIFQTQQILKL